MNKRIKEKIETNNRVNFPGQETKGGRPDVRPQSGLGIGSEGGWGSRPW